jgi:hypothetical protein
MNLNFCACLVFLNGWSEGRIERYQDCPRHWRLVGDGDVIPRDSVAVDLDEFLDLAEA